MKLSNLSKNLNRIENYLDKQKTILAVKTNQEEINVRVFIFGKGDSEENWKFNSKDEAIKYLAENLTKQSNEHERLYKKLKYIEKLAKAK